MCRFHVDYDDEWGVHGQEDTGVDVLWADEEWEGEEEQWCDYWQRYEVATQGDPIELKKVSFIFHDTRWDMFCASCHPLILPRNAGVEDWCCCSVYDHFVKPWRCIPCVLAEEARAARATRDSGPVEWSKAHRQYFAVSHMNSQ